MSDPSETGFTVDDEELTSRAQSGDIAAFEVLIERYQDRVVRVAYSVLRDSDEALDVAQEAFFRVFKKIKSFHGKSSFYTWLYRITINIAIDRTRSRKRKQAESLDARQDKTQDTLRPEIPSQDPGPASEAADQELEGRLNQAIDSLPPKHRQVILLREVEGLSYQEIADVVGCTVGTVMSRLHYAREGLKDKVKPYLGGTSYQEAG